MNFVAGLRRRSNGSSGLFALILFGAAAVTLNAGELHYLAPGRPDAVALLAPPPLPDSVEQAADLASVAAVCKARTKNDEALARSEKTFFIFSFTTAIGRLFQPGNLPKTEAFFQRVQDDTESIVTSAKFFWKRPRPFVVAPELVAGETNLEITFSYPSGHSTRATVFALLLADLFPDKREQIFAIGRDVGWHRVQIARHYPTDIYAGRTFARAIVRELKTSRAFQHDFNEAKKEIAAALRSQAPAVPAH